MRNIFPLQIQRLQGERVLDTLLSQAAHPPGNSGEIVLNQSCKWGILEVPVGTSLRVFIIRYLVNRQKKSWTYGLGETGQGFVYV